MRTRPAAIAALALATLTAPLAHAQLNRSTIPQTENAGLVRNEGAQVDLTLPFTDHTERDVTLADAFTGDQPVILLLAYFDCPLICPLTLRNFSQALSDIDNMKPGKDYRALVISFDHNDTPADAKLQRDRFLGPGFTHTPEDNGVLFWTAAPQHAKQLAETVGFYYEYYPNVDDFAHTSALILLDPDGTVHNYYPGIEYEPDTLRRLTLQAGSKAERTIIEQAALYCFTWRPGENEWAISPIRLMQVIGGITVALTAAALIALFIFDRIRWSKPTPPGGPAAA